MKFVNGEKGKKQEKEFMAKYHYFLARNEEMIVDIENRIKKAKSEEEKRRLEYEKKCLKEAIKENAWESAKQSFSD